MHFAFSADFVSQVGRHASTPSPPQHQWQSSPSLVLVSCCSNPTPNSSHVHEVSVEHVCEDFAPHVGGFGHAGNSPPSPSVRLDEGSQQLKQIPALDVVLNCTKPAWHLHPASAVHFDRAGSDAQNWLQESAPSLVSEQQASQLSPPTVSSVNFVNPSGQRHCFEVGEHVLFSADLVGQVG